MNPILTVADLIGILEKQNPESPVHLFNYEFQVTDPINEVYYNGSEVVIG